MWLQKFTEYFVNRPTIFWSLMAAIIIAGIISFSMMPKLEDPAICAKQANVVAIYPGASAHEVELKLVKPVEDKLRTLPDVKEIRSEVSAGMAIITVEFEMTVLNEELEQHFDLLRRKTTEAKLTLPAGAMDLIVVDDMMDTYGIFYALKFDGYSYSEADRYAQHLRNALLAVPGVKRVNIAGGRTEQIDVILSKDKLARNGFIPSQIMIQMQNQGKVADAGKIDVDGRRVSLRVSDGLTDESDVADMLIKDASGRPVRLGDIAEVRRAYKEPQTGAFFVEGEAALAICVALEDNVVVPDVGKIVDKKVNAMIAEMPVGFSMEKIFFQPDKVDSAISTFLVNLLESVLIVIIVLVFAMGFRAGVIIGLGLVLTIAASFPILLSLGSTLQRISLGAFIIAMGMLVDNSIVIMDGILVDKKQGLPMKEYLYGIGRRTAWPLLGATVIAVATFLSPYLSPDTAGEYCRDLFLVLCVSLLMSWLLALVQVPMCAGSWLPKNSAGPEKESRVYGSRIHRAVGKALSFMIDWRKTTIISSILVLVAVIFSATKVKNLFFPDFDYNQFIIEYTMPPQTSPDCVRADLMEIMASLDSIPEVERVAMSMGSAPAHYCLVRPMTNGGDNYGELMVDCADFKTVNALIKDIKPKLRQQYPDAYIRFRKYNFSVATSHPVEVRFYGPDPAELKRLAKEAGEIMKRSPYIDRYSVRDNWQAMGKRYVADFEQADALKAGLSRGNVADAMLAATDGLPVGVVNDDDNMLVVNLKVRNEDGSMIDDINDIPVWSMMNVSFDPEKIPDIMSGAASVDDLRDNMFVALPMSCVTKNVRVDWEEPFVFRVNGVRSIEVEADPNTDIYEGTVAKAVSDIEDDIKSIRLPAGYTMELAGESKVQFDATGNIIRYLPITIFIILGILLLLFGRWKLVLLILTCLPFVFLGIIPALLVFRQPFTFMAIIGLMGLIGMMVKNGIVLVDEINRLQREENKTPYESVITATVSRVRPVIMASLTTILGMAPLIADPMYGSMAICIMAGLTMGTVITLLLLPVFYSAFFNVKKQ